MIYRIYFKYLIYNMWILLALIYLKVSLYLFNQNKQQRFIRWIRDILANYELIVIIIWYVVIRKIFRNGLYCHAEGRGRGERNTYKTHFLSFILKTGCTQKKKKKTYSFITTMKYCDLRAPFASSKNWR